MSHHVLIRHKVSDFGSWKTGFDAHKSKRAEAGLTHEQVLRSADDANEVVILCKAQDLNRAKAFMNAPGLREAMQAAGVADKPDIYFLNG
jgi:hypothetical protein